MTTAAQFNEQGVHLKRQGRFGEAQASYERALELDPNYAEARFNLGVLWRDLGRVDLAIDCLQTTLRIRPDVSLIHFELANVLAASGELDAALEHYEQAIALAPDFTSAMFNLANIYLHQQRWSDAEGWYRRILQGAPGEIDACFNLGFALHAQSRFGEASEIYRQIVDVKPNNAAALTALANTYKEQSALELAREYYEQAIKADANCVEAHVNLGNLCLECGWLDHSLEHYSAAARLQPADPQSSLRLGNLYHRLENVTAAEHHYQRALELDPDCFEARLSVSHLRREIGDFKQSQLMCREIARRKSSQPLDRLRELACCPLVFGSRDELDRYRAELTATVRAIRGTELKIDVRRLTMFAPECPYNLQFLDGNLRPLKQSFADVYSQYFAQHNAHADRLPRRSGKPRIGFVVTHRHESAFLKLIAGVVQRIRADSFELVVLCSTYGAAKIRSGLRRNDVTIVSFAERFDHVVDAVRDARCDLLYYWEIGNDPTNYFLPFLRLAPVQVTSWGIQVTSGIPTVDAYLSSELVEVPEAQDHYSERLMLASTLLTYQLPIALPPGRKSRDELGLPVGASIYGCLQNLGKFHPDFDDVLGSILRTDPSGLLVVTEDRNGYAAEILRARWRKRLADVYDRVVFLPLLAQNDYFQVLSQCDVLLDPLHFGGVTTTYDALWLSKPVVTLPTQFHRGRYTAGCLRKIGVTDTIARDLSEYVDLAVSLATQRDRREELAKRLCEAKHTAFEDYGAAGEHERIFHELLAGVR